MCWFTWVFLEASKCDSFSPDNCGSFLLADVTEAVDLQFSVENQIIFILCESHFISLTAHLLKTRQMCASISCRLPLFFLPLSRAGGCSALDFSSVWELHFSSVCEAAVTSGVGLVLQLVSIFTGEESAIELWLLFSSILEPYSYEHTWVNTTRNTRHLDPVFKMYVIKGCSYLWWS